MKRIVTTPRVKFPASKELLRKLLRELRERYPSIRQEIKTWQDVVEIQGLTYHSDGQPPSDNNPGCWWDESIYYELSLAEVDVIEAATKELHEMCMAAVPRVVNDSLLMKKMGIPDHFARLAKESWDLKIPHLYGRFDLAWHNGTPKMLEYNADTPTSLVESAVIQWFWLCDKFPEKGERAEQFNSIHEKLVARWREIGEKFDSITETFFFTAHGDYEEEVMTVEYMRSVAEEAGILTDYIDIQDLGWSDEAQCFTDLNDLEVRFLFKLYPWEFLWQEEYGQNLSSISSDVGLIEPAWKMILSNKAILPILWDMFPGHPNLLEAKWSSPFSKLEDGWVSKPILGREGMNIKIGNNHHGGEYGTTGIYGDQPVIYQKQANLLLCDGNYSVIGSWVVGDEPAGCIFRENLSPIITGDSKIVPHFFTP